MTPAEHVARAETLVEKAHNLNSSWSEGERIAISILSLTHATIALAVELGTPHQAADTAAASSG